VAIRLYLSALTLVFLFAASMNRGLDWLEATVVTCALLYLILDTREHLMLVRAEIEALQQLEKKISALLR
jgi:hypothetical protein